MAVLVAVAGVSAFAQDSPRPARPYRGLFGGAQPDSARSQALDLNLSFVGGYDDNVAAGAGGSSGAGAGSLGDPRFGESGTLANASASLTYRKTRKENSFFAGGRTGFRYFPSVTELNAADYSASAGFSVKPSRRTQLAANQDVSYQPFFSLSAVPLFGGAPASGLPMATLDFAFASRPSITYSSAVNGSLDLGRRTHATGSYAFRGFDFTQSTDEGRMRQQDASVGLSRDFTRRVRLGGRYAYDFGDSSYLGPRYTTRSHGGEVTFDYRRTLRSRRQFSFGFSGGYSRVESETLLLQRRFDRRVTAGARLSVDLGRTWTASADYRRGLRHLPGVADAIFSDDVQARLAGLLGRRVDVSLAGQYSKGEAGYSALGGFDSASGTAQFRWAASRMTALTASYVYYRYEFPPGTALPLGLDRRFSRNAVRVGVDLWLPLYR